MGNYRLLERIGTGGMGDVYRAEQTHPVRRVVAVKIIKRGMDTRQVIARFEAERQALALMDHPNIAKIFDAGTTPRGRPYFVMEYVKGVPITTYCDKQKLTTRERLQLFMQLCDGVQHAHQKAIIHRDLKPSNVLVAIQDGKPVPKIIDFGVAKAAAQKLTERTVYTALGELIGTPEYMSPEQAEMTGEDVDTRTDVYSLGVILYELLAGGLPFEPEKLRQAGFQGIVHTIREQDPPRPSIKVGTLRESMTQVANARRTLPGKLKGQLRGDLDWITMRCLEKDRTRRYASAAELSADVRRHLRHEPVSAGPPGAAYWASKFVRRHRAGVVAGSAVAVSIVVATVISVRFAVSEARQRRIAATERDTARAVNDFLNNDLLAAAAPSAQRGRGKDVVMRVVLDEAAKRIDEAAAAGGKFENKPLVEASIRRTLGVTYEALGDYPAAEPHMKRALELRSLELGEEHVETLETMKELGYLYMAQARYDEAARLRVKTLEIKTRVLGEEHPATARSMADLAWVYRTQKRYDKCEPLYLKALEIQRRVLGEEHRATLRTMWQLADLASVRGQNEQAKRMFVETVEIMKRVLGEEDPLTVHCMRESARVYMALGRYEDAEPLLRKVLEIQKRVEGEEHPRRLDSMHYLALLYTDQGRYDEAERQYLEMIAIKKRVLGAEHRETLLSTDYLADLYRLQGRYDEAEALLVKTLDIYRRVLGEEHVDTARPMRYLAQLYTDQARYDEAAPMLLEAVAIQKQVVGGRADTVWSLNLLARVYISQRRYYEAEVALLEAHEILTSAGSEPPAISEQIESLVRLYDAWGKPEQSAKWLERLSSPQAAAARD